MAELEGLWYALLLWEGPSWRRRGGAREPRRWVRGEDGVGDGDGEREVPFLWVERGGGVGDGERRRLCFLWDLVLPSSSLSDRENLCLESRRSGEQSLRGLSFDRLAGDLDLEPSELESFLCLRDLCSSRPRFFPCLVRSIVVSSSLVLLLFRSRPSSHSR